MSHLFSFCNKLSSLPDISKWNTNNLTNMRSLFFCCESLISLPDISKWNTNNVTNFLIVINYHLYLIFLNGIQIMLLI